MLSYIASLLTIYDDVINQKALAALQLDDVLLFEEAVVEIEEKPYRQLFRDWASGFDSLKRGTTIAVQLIKHISEKWSALLRVGSPSFAKSVQSNDPAGQALKD
jgi:hypothetical protein